MAQQTVLHPYDGIVLSRENQVRVHEATGLTGLGKTVLSLNLSTTYLPRKLPAIVPMRIVPFARKCYMEKPYEWVGHQILIWSL